MLLDSTTRKLQLVLKAAKTTLDMPVTVDYVDVTATALPVAGLALSNSNGVTIVDILAAPAASTQRKVNGITIYNKDTAAKALQIILNDNGTSYIIVDCTLQVDDTLGYTDTGGWYTQDVNGCRKTVLSLYTSPSISTSITTPSTTFALLNETATTINAFGAATAINVGAATGTLTLNNPTISLPTLATRITGDMSNATDSNRLTYQSSTINGATILNIAPNGTSNISAIDIFQKSSMVDSPIISMYTNVTVNTIDSTRNGTGTSLPLVLSIQGAEKCRIDTGGTTTLGGTSALPALKVIPGGGNVNWVTITGSATNPTIGVSGGNLALAGVVNVASAIATPAGGSTSAVLLFGTTAGFGIYYGSGAPTVTAAAGSLYIRTDNAGANLRLYSNTTGSTVWAAITSA